jgi:hypothetical protein
MSVAPMSAAADEVHYLDDVAAFQRVRSEHVAVAKDRSVVLYDNQSRVDSERAKQLAKRAISRNLPRGSVHRQRDRPVRARRLHHTPKYSG